MSTDELQIDQGTSVVLSVLLRVVHCEEGLVVLNIVSLRLRIHRALTGRHQLGGRRAAS
jgi:hypothetical protein